MAAKKKAPKGDTKKRSKVTVIVGRDAASRRLLATAMAREVGKELHRIDLGKLINKYIGETEKALSAALARAETLDAMLFFDEADALFGKRSDVKSAHDRYANLEMSYLLGFARLTPQVEAFADAVLRPKPRRKKKDD
jgi:SpoVK/Ycf46/Vps4 family AAA+-type ATPase